MLVQTDIRAQPKFYVADQRHYVVCSENIPNPLEFQIASPNWRPLMEDFAFFGYDYEDSILFRILACCGCTSRVAKACSRLMKCSSISAFQTHNTGRMSSESTQILRNPFSLAATLLRNTNPTSMRGTNRCRNLPVSVSVRSSVTQIGGKMLLTMELIRETKDGMAREGVYWRVISSSLAKSSRLDLTMAKPRKCSKARCNGHPTLQLMR